MSPHEKACNLAVVRLEAHTEYAHGIDKLASAYPELDFLFDEVRDYRRIVKEIELGERENAEEKVGGLTIELHHTRENNAALISTISLIRKTLLAKSLFPDLVEEINTTLNGLE